MLFLGIGRFQVQPSSIKQGRFSRNVLQKWFVSSSFKPCPSDI